MSKPLALYPGSNCATPTNRNLIAIVEPHLRFPPGRGRRLHLQSSPSEWALLPKFFFQVIENGVEGPLDEEGLDYPSLDAAEQDAAAVIAGMMDNANPQGTQTVEIVIGDEHRKPVARVKASLSRDRMS